MLLQQDSCLSMDKRYQQAPINCKIKIKTIYKLYEKQHPISDFSLFITKRVEISRSKLKNFETYMACKHVKHQVISRTSPCCFCNNTRSFDNLCCKWKDKVESRDILKNDNETKNILRVGHG